MGIYSGKDAYVDGVPCTTSWGATLAVALSKYSASCLAGATNTPPGVRNWTGQMAGFGSFPEAVLPSYTPLDFQGVINNTGGSLKSLTGSIYIEQLTIDINKATQAPISWTATFGVDGDLAEAATGADDSVVSEAENGKDLGITIVATPITQNIQSAQIILKRALTTYVDAGTTKRKAGNLEADISFSVLESIVEVAAYAPNALSLVKVLCGGGKYWEFSKIRFGGKSGLTVDRSANAIIGYTVNGGWNAVEGTTEGYLTYYNGASYETALYGTNPS
jgi:hypothetical protein